MKYILIALSLGLTACQSKFDSLEAPLTEAADEAGCLNQESAMWDVLYASLENTETVPSEGEMSTLSKKVIRDRILDEEAQRAVSLSFVSFYQQVGLDQLHDLTLEEKREYLASLEIGNTTTPEAAAIQERLEAWRKSEVQKQVKAFALNCSSQDSPIIAPPDDRLGIPLVAWGARKVFATAFQSCAAENVQPLNRSTPDLEGIKIVGTHSDGVGSKRQISDLNALNRTNPYLRAYSPSSSCTDVRTNPLIYDYGGKPYASPSPSSTLNLFKNAGSGTSVLGIDCSGYVFSSMAVAGLKLHPNKVMKASLVSGVSSRMLLDPVKNGMTCLDKIKVGKSGDMKEGDIVSISGHTFVVESIGSDPLGSKAPTTTAQCDSITYEDFDFVVAQSSPSKGGVGLNKFKAADYLEQSPTMRQGLEGYARQSCKARLQAKDVLPSVSTLSVIRHKMTAACTTQAIRLDGESCVSGCQF